MLEKNEKKSFSNVCDSHLHLVECAARENVFEEINSFKSYNACACFLTPEEWEQVPVSPKIFKCFGLHPQNPNLRYAFFLQNLLEHNELDAIGETGFDFFTPELRSLEKDQEKVWYLQLVMAFEFYKPLILHCRKSLERILYDSALLRKVPAVVFHGFPAGIREAESILRKDVNAYFCVGKALLRGSKKALELVQKLPSDRLLLETDAPYMTLKNEKFSSVSDIEKVYEKAFDIRKTVEFSLTEKEFERQILKNFTTVFSR